MPKILCITKDMPRETWLEWRKKGIGGSDVSILCGINKWKTSVGLYLDKIGQVEIQQSQETEEKMYWGNVLEDVVAHEFTNRTGKKVRRKNAMFVHDDYSFMIANVDREIVGENAGLEVKTAGSYALHDWEDNKIPQYYQLQCQHYMEVMGWNRMYVACLIGGQKFVIRTIEKDPEVINYMIELERNFWENNVLKNIPPVIDGTEASGDLLDMLYPIGIPQKPIINLPDVLLYSLNEIEALTDQIKKLDEQKSLHENKIKMCMADHETAILNNYKVTWKTAHRLHLDTKKLKEDHEDLLRQYSSDTSYRKFSIKKSK